MVITDATLYLPISNQTLRKILGDSQALESVVSGLSVPQIAALIVLQYLPNLRENPSVSPERILAEAINAGNIYMEREGFAAVIADALTKLSRENLQEGYQLLSDFRIVLLDEETLKHRNYLTVEGNWDYGFRERHKTQLMDHLIQVDFYSNEIRALTAEQSRIYREVKAQADDHIHVQGYAGTGKSSLIKSLLMMLEPTGARILILAERKQQLDALLAGINQGKHVTAKTFGALAYEIIPPDLTSSKNQRLRRLDKSQAPISDAELIRRLGIHASGAFSILNIIKAVRGTVASFCYSGDNEIDVNHIPDWCLSLFDQTTKQVVLHHATELWKAIHTPPSKDFKIPVRGYHRVKWAALNRWQIPSHYTHVLIDECHDLSKSMLQILDCSLQAVISLGDEYQNLQGRPQQRSAIIRQREATHSVRSGRLIENIVNPIIAIHPGKTKALFHGNELHKIEINYYSKPQIPEQPATILTNDIWELFEWAQRMAIENIDFELLSSRDHLDMFVQDCIELYLHGTRPRHGELFRFGSWAAVARAHHNNHGFQRIDRMLNKGYAYKDWLKTSTKFVERYPHMYSLGLIEDVRNREFETVLLTPKIVSLDWNVESTKAAAISSAIYVAVTRAKHRLIVPEGLRNWIEEISATQAPQQRINELIDTL